jgi:hypothetical protein
MVTMNPLPENPLSGGWKLLLAVGCTAFLAGYGTDSWIRHRRAERVGVMQFQEFLRIAIDLGIVTVDERRLEEVIIAGTEDVPEEERAP